MRVMSGVSGVRDAWPRYELLSCTSNVRNDVGKAMLKNTWGWLVRWYVWRGSKWELHSLANGKRASREQYICMYVCMDSAVMRWVPGS